VSMQDCAPLKVRERAKGDIYVQGLTKHPVDSYGAIAKKMEEGSTNRSIGATLMNQTSSRAHTIITIQFRQVKEQVEDGVQRKTEKLSVIHLVDLAGSEKAGQTGAEGQRLKEGISINSSLTVLGNCIEILASRAGGKNKNAVVPFRDSNLTRILQNSLGGNSKTIMICALSPSSTNYDESLSTLRYADRAKKIMLKATVNESVQDKMIRELKEENERFKQVLM
jgi:kinesin family member 13